MLCNVTVLVIVIVKERVPCSNVWVEFVGYGIGIPFPPTPYLFVLSYRHNFVHRVQLF